MPRNDETTRLFSRRQRLARLRDLMHSACDLSEPVAYFLDQLAQDRVFCRRSQPGDPGLDLILGAIAVAMFGPDGALGERSLRCYGGLWHGRCVFVSGEATVLYHGDIDVGIVDLPFEGARAFIRFNTRNWKMRPAAEQPSS